MTTPSELRHLLYRCCVCCLIFIMILIIIYTVLHLIIWTEGSTSTHDYLSKSGPTTSPVENDGVTTTWRALNNSFLNVSFFVDDIDGRNILNEIAVGSHALDIE